jgi:hypothetical protein
LQALLKIVRCAGEERRVFIILLSYPGRADTQVRPYIRT